MRSFPSWLHKKLPKKAPTYVTDILQRYGLSTVCEEAKCPNRSECFANKRATFLALGNICTRKCAFCNISSDLSPLSPDPKEPEKIAACAKKLGLCYVVITMVTRDDLPDGGSHHMVKIIRSLQKQSLKTEVLISDLGGSFQALDQILAANPHVLNHNIETVESLTPKIRNKAQYHRSLNLLSHSKSSSFLGLVKSGLMVGLGETNKEVQKTIKDLASAGCDIVTIGQYLQPHRNNIPVKEFIHPDIFDEYREFGQSVGIKQMICHPFVRSSYFEGNSILMKI